MSYKIFTEEEFNQRVKLFWDMMIKSEFPEWECVPIAHDRAKRRTRNLGKCHYKNKKPYKLSFSYRMLDGRFTLDFVNDVIKHEVGHALAYLRYDECCGHDQRFHQIAKEFDFEGDSKADLVYSDNYKDKYFFVCSCGKEYKYYDPPSFIKKAIKLSHTKVGRKCGDCGMNEFVLYIFEDGVDRNIDIDCEAYYNMYGGVKI